MSCRKVFTASQRFQYGCYQFLDHFLGRERVFKLLGKGRKKFFKRIHESLKAQGEGKVLKVERRKNLSLKEFRKNYLNKGVPVILEGAAKEWDCCRNWSLDYFQNLHGDDEIVYVDNSVIENSFEITTLKEVLGNIRGGGSKYYRFYPLLSRHPEHLNDFDMKWLRERRNSFSVSEEFQIFMGGKGRVTPIHNALAPNLFVQAFGEKKWFLYPTAYTLVIDPEPARNLYRSAPFRTPQGPFDPFNPDYNTPYTLYKYIDSYEADLRQGDILWNPPYYWHAVRNETDSIGVGYRWIAPFYHFRLAPLYAFLELFTNKPPVWKAWTLRKDFNLLQLAETGRLKEYKKLLAERKKKNAVS